MLRPEDLRTIGVIVGVHGLQGAVKIAPLSDFPDRYFALERVYLKRNEVIVSENRVKRVRWAGNTVHLAVREITSRDAAQTLIGSEVCIPDSETWELPEDVFYVTSLLGCAVVGDDGTKLGIVKSVLDGPQSILEIRDGVKEYLVPFVADWVGTVDCEAKLIVILNWQRLISPEIVDGADEQDDH